MENNIKYHIGSIIEGDKILRKCRTCRNIKELNEDNFLKRNTENGWRGDCRICYNKKSRNKQELSKRELVVGKKYRDKYKKEKPLETLLKVARGNAKRRYKEFSISIEDLKELWTLQNGLCFYTNDKMLFKLGCIDSVSIDRVDSSKGYTKSNIVLCKYKVNVMKNDSSVEELLSFCKKVLSTNHKLKIDNNE